MNLDTSAEMLRCLLEPRFPAVKKVQVVQVLYRGLYERRAYRESPVLVPLVAVFENKEARMITLRAYVYVEGPGWAYAGMRFALALVRDGSFDYMLYVTRKFDERFTTLLSKA